jgi:uncharacterized protein (TIGR03435 family)
MWAKGLSMMVLADMLSDLRPEIDRYVEDRTELPGLFDWELSWSADKANPFSTGQPEPLTLFPDSRGVSLFTALREQLGLKLEPGRAPIPVLVIDSINQPTAN